MGSPANDRFTVAAGTVSTRVIDGLVFAPALGPEHLGAVVKLSGRGRTNRIGAHWFYECRCHGLDGHQGNGFETRRAAVGGLLVHLGHAHLEESP